MSADGKILVYSASGFCMRDAADEIDLDADDDSSKRVCLAYLQAAGQTLATKTEAKPADPWTGKWTGSGEGSLSATIRRNTTESDEMRVDLYTGTQACSGAVTLYGKPHGTTLIGESKEPNEPDAPACRIELSIDSKGTLKTEVAGPCAYYHGGACGFDGTLTRSE